MSSRQTRLARREKSVGFERWIVLAGLAGSVLVARKWGILDAWFLLPPVLALALFIAGFTVRRLRSRLTREEIARGSLVQEINGLTSESERRIRELRTLYESSLDVSQSAEREDVTASLAEDARQIASAEVSCVFLLEGQRVKSVQKVGTDDLDQFRLIPGEPVDAGGIVAHLMEHREPLVISSVGEEDRMKCAPEVPWAEMRSLVAIPLVSGTSVLGGVLLGSGETGVFTGEEVRVLTILSNLAGAALEKLRYSKDLSGRIEELEDELQALRFGAEMKSRLVSTLTRELRSPVLAARDLAETLAAVPASSGGHLRRPMAEAVSAEAGRALAAAEELDAVAGTGPSVPAPVPAEVPLAELVHELTVKRTASAVRRDVLLRTQASSPDVTIRGDRGLLRAGLDLLLEFLVEMARRDSALCLAVGEKSGTARVVITGESSGEYISALERGLAAGGSSAGTNLPRWKGHRMGLALTRSAIQQHAGCVRVDPRSTGAFQVVVSLPAGRSVRCLPHEVTRMLSPGTDHSRLIDVMTALVAGLAGARRVTLLLGDARDNELYVQSGYGIDDVEARHLRIPVGQGAIGRVAETGVGRLQRDEVGSVSKTRVLAPLVWNSECFGVLEARERKDEREFQDSDLHLVQHLAALIARALARESDPEMVRQDLVENLAMMASVAGASGPITNRPPVPETTDRVLKQATEAGREKVAPRPAAPEPADITRPSTPDSAQGASRQPARPNSPERVEPSTEDEPDEALQHPTQADPDEVLQCWEESCPDEILDREESPAEKTLQKREESLC